MVGLEGEKKKPIILDVKKNLDQSITYMLTI